jgi:hypothetical protein
VIHSTGRHINETFGITNEKAHELIDTIQSKWDVLMSGKEHSNYTVGDLLFSIATSDKYTTVEKCYLCQHVAHVFEICTIREIFLLNDAEGFCEEVGLIVPK